MISTDRKLFEKDSVAAKRMVAYGKVFDQLHIIIFSLRKHNFQSERLSENVWVYPTSSFLRVGYINDALRIAQNILSNITHPESGWVVTTQDPFETGLVGRRLKAQVKIPLHIQVHTDIGSELFRNTFLNKIRMMFVEGVLKEADAVRVVSDRIKATLIGKYHVPADKIRVLPLHAIESSISFPFKEKKENEELVVLVASRLTKEKNIPMVIDAFDDVIKKCRDVRLVIVGEGPERSVLRKRVDQYHIDDKVTFVGWSDTLDDYFKEADIFALSSDYEGYGRTLVEASLAHIPIVTTNVGVVGSLLVPGDDVVVCDPRDTRCFTDQLTHLVLSPETRREMAESAYVKTKEHVMSQKEYVEAYRRSILDAVVKM